MEKIASFTINHLSLLPGVYVSRKDRVGEKHVNHVQRLYLCPAKSLDRDTAQC